MDRNLLWPVCLNVDTWGYHYFSVEEYKLFFQNPSEYIFNIFHIDIGEYSRFFFTRIIPGGMISRVICLLNFFHLVNIFSFGNYYVNVIFYSFITIIGPIAIYRVFSDVFPGKKVQVLVATFLIPSFAYWTSGFIKMVLFLWL